MAKPTFSDTQRRITEENFQLAQAGLLGGINQSRIEEILARAEANRLREENRFSAGKAIPAVTATLAGLAAAPFTAGASLPAALAIAGGAGALGGGLGEIGRQKFTGRADALGFDVGDVLEEAAISGAIDAGTLGLGRAFGAARAGSAAKAASKADDLGAIAQRGRNARLDVLRPEKALSKSEISPFNIGSVQDDVLKFDADYLPAGSIQTKLNAMGGVSDDLVKQADDVLSTVKSRTNVTSLQNKMKSILKRKGMLETAADEKRVARIFDDIISKEVADPNNITATQVNAVRRQINKRLTAVYTKAGKGANLSAADEAVLSMKEGIDDVLESIVPKESLEQFRAVNSQLRVANDTSKALFSNLGSETPTLFGLRSGGLRRVLQSARDRYGRVLQGVGSGSGSVTSLAEALARPTGVAAMTTAAQLGARDLDGDGVISQAELDADADIEALFGADALQPQQPTTLAGTLSDPAIIQQLMMQDLATTGGENITALKTILEIGQMTAGTGGAELSAAQQKSLSQFQSAEAVLDELMSNFQAAGGAQGRVGGTLASALGTIGFNDEVSVFNQRREAAMSLLARALGEVGVLTDQDIQRALGNIPKITDNPGEAAAKIQSIKNLLADLQGIAMSNPTATSNPADALAEANAAIGGM